MNIFCSYQKFFFLLQPLDAGEKILYMYLERFPHNQQKFAAFKNTPLMMLKGKLYEWVTLRLILLLNFICEKFSSWLTFSRRTRVERLYWWKWRHRRKSLKYRNINIFPSRNARFPQPRQQNHVSLVNRPKVLSTLKALSFFQEHFRHRNRLPRQTGRHRRDCSSAQRDGKESSSTRDTEEGLRGIARYHHRGPRRLVPLGRRRQNRLEWFNRYCVSCCLHKPRREATVVVDKIMPRACDS